MVLLGWANERMGDYEKAIEMYEKAMSIYSRQEVIIFIEMAKRKSKS